MNINKQYAWQPAEYRRENNPLLPRIYENLLVERVEVGELQRSSILYVFGMSLHQQEYKVLRNGLDARLSKQQLCSAVKERYIQRIYLLLQPLKN